MRRECRARFPRNRRQRKSLVSDPGMQHGTCVTHVPWCMSGSLNRGDEKSVPGISGACATHKLTYLAIGPLNILVIVRHGMLGRTELSLVILMVSHQIIASMDCDLRMHANKWNNAQRKPNEHTFYFDKRIKDITCRSQMSRHRKASYYKATLAAPRYALISHILWLDSERLTTKSFQLTNW